MEKKDEEELTELFRDEGSKEEIASVRHKGGLTAEQIAEVKDYAEDLKELESESEMAKLKEKFDEQEIAEAERDRGTSVLVDNTGKLFDFLLELDVMIIKILMNVPFTFLELYKWYFF
ncbi:hypothetical protein ACJX0J_037226 [Zea mays]